MALFAGLLARFISACAFNLTISSWSNEVLSNLELVPQPCPSSNSYGFGVAFEKLCQIAVSRKLLSNHALSDYRSALSQRIRIRYLWAVIDAGMTLLTHGQLSINI